MFLFVFPNIFNGIYRFKWFTRIYIVWTTYYFEILKNNYIVVFLLTQFINAVYRCYKLRSQLIGCFEMLFLELVFGIYGNNFCTKSQNKCRVEWENVNLSDFVVVVFSWASMLISWYAYGMNNFSFISICCSFVVYRVMEFSFEIFILYFLLSAYTWTKPITTTSATYFDLTYSNTQHNREEK